MEEIRQGFGVVRTIHGTAPTSRSDGTALAAGEISHYLWFIEKAGGVPALAIAVNLVDGDFDDGFEADDVDPGEYSFRYRTVDTEGRESVDSSTLTISILRPLAAPNPPSSIS